MERTEASRICYVIAGPNGAGKTTFGMWYLPRVARCVEFVNADSIARGLSPLNETAVQMEAGRLFLARIRELRKRMQPLAIETTLSGRGHMRLADYVAVWDNSAERPVLLYERTAKDEVVLDETIWARIEEYGA